MSLFSALLPAAHTKMMPALPAAWIASISAWEAPWLPKLALSALTLWAIAYSMQGSSAEVDPEPVASMNLSSISCTVHATPVTPRLLLPTAPTIPDTCVPWPTSSVGGPLMFTALSPLVLSVSLIVLGSSEAYDIVVFGARLTQRLATRSWWVRSAPESRMPTMMPEALVLVFQPASALMSAPAMPPFPPVLLSAHWLVNWGSLGVRAVCRMRSGSTYS